MRVNLRGTRADTLSAMWLDATLAYLHFSAVFIFFGFLSIELWLVRSPVDAARAGELRRADVWYWGAAAAVLLTGAARLFLGARGFAFHAHSGPLYLKVLLFGAIAALSLAPRVTFRHWAREAATVPRWKAPEAQRLGTRRRLMATLHIAALLPLLAALMARGLP